MEASGSPPPSQEAELGAPAGSPLRQRSDSSLQGSPTSAALMTEVRQLKGILDDKSQAEPAVLDALTKLESHGTLPTKILSDTLIGRTVNNLAKSSPVPAVREAALKLVSSWKDNHRKRKASAIERSQSTVSLDSELAPSPTMSRVGSVLSQDTMEVTATPEASSEATAEEDKNKLTPKREKIIEKIAEAFGSVEKLDVVEGSGNDDTDMKDPRTLATEIEKALNDQLTEKDYVAQARAVLFNLKDKKNHLFRFKLLVGAIQPSLVPKLNASDMASDEKNAERRKQRDDAMAAIDQDWAMKNGQIRISGLFTCGKCKGTQTTYFQMQTRSSDEPMTTFATCLTCGNRWKFC